MALEVGKSAPAFKLPATGGKKIALADFKGQPVVVYFYPRDATPGCTTEACDFRDQIAHLQALKGVVLGISTDSVASHEKFAAAQGLNFPLLADEDHAVAEKYGVWVEKNMYGKKSFGVQRATFLIDAAGKLAHIWPKVKVDGHAQEVADRLAELVG